MIENQPEYEVGAPTVPEYDVGLPERNVELEKAERLTFHELVEFSTDDFVLMQGGNPCLWVGGYLLAFYPVNPEFFDRTLNLGVRWYRQISYAVMPEFKPVIKIFGNSEAQIIDYSKSSVGELMAEFITKERKKNES